MRQENESLILIKAISAKENRKRLKMILAGAFIFNVAGFTFMYGLLYLISWMDGLF